MLSVILVCVLCFIDVDGKGYWHSGQGTTRLWLRLSLHVVRLVIFSLRPSGTIYLKSRLLWSMSSSVVVFSYEKSAHFQLN